ncbi:hypothetical protein CEXT_595401, partial [Caerostris extrusa]
VAYLERGGRREGSWLLGIVLLLIVTSLLSLNTSG